MTYKTCKTPKYECQICSKGFASIQILSRHQKLLHDIIEIKIKQEKKIKGEAQKEKNIQTNKPRNYPCDQCDKSFLGKNDLRKHIRTHTNERPYVCNECGFAFKQAGSLKNHIYCKHSPGLQSSEIFVCEYCDKHFPIKERLKLHLRVHTRERPYKCTQCSKDFARGGQLSQHMRVHTKEKPYVCNICQSSFTCGANLKAHLNRHLNIRQHICDICGKSFLRKDALRKHLNCFHANVKAFHCKICNKNFKGHLPQHIRTHSKNKPHGCESCGARFAQRSQLTVHQRMHSGEKPYRCLVCWKAFGHTTALKLHTRRHTGEKPYLCFICNIGFSQVPHLKKHMLCIHQSNKPYYCEFCKKFFKTKAELQTHRETKCKRKKKVENEVKIKREKIEPPMSLSKMRLLLAVLLKKISTTERLKELRFNKRLIDDILVDSIIHSGRNPCKVEGLSVAEKLKLNIEILLEWTIPQKFREKFQNEQRSTEELLEELTS